MEQVKNQFPLISFLIPAYNHADFILETLESLYQDQYVNKEIIIIDDGSSDDTADKIEKWIASKADLDIQFFKQKNSGVVNTINRLIGLSKGSYIRLFSSDDINFPHSTSRMYEELVKNPKYEAIFSDARVIDLNGNLIAESAISFQNKDKSLYTQDLGKALISQWGVSGPCILYSRAAYDDILGKYDESLVAEDWYSYLKLYSQGKLLFLDDYVIKYRVHGRNISRSKQVSVRLQNLESHLRVAKLIEKLVSGRDKFLIHAQQNLVEAKMSYLRRKYFSTALSLVYYFSKEFIAKLCR